MKDFFIYNHEKIYTGSEIYVEGKLFDMNNELIEWVGHKSATFKYIDDNKIYLDVDGKQVYGKSDITKGRLKVQYLITKNGKPVPDPRGQEDVDLATIGLAAAMGVSSIFVGAPLWWATELYYYMKYRKKKLYPDIDKKDWRKKK